MSEKANQPDPIRLQVIWDYLTQEKSKSDYNPNIIQTLALLYLQGEDGRIFIVPPPIPEIQFQEMIRAIDAEVEKRRQEKSQE